MKEQCDFQLTLPEFQIQQTVSLHEGFSYKTNLTEINNDVFILYDYETVSILHNIIYGKVYEVNQKMSLPCFYYKSFLIFYNFMISKGISTIQTHKN